MICCLQEIAAVRRDAKETEQQLKERITRLEAQRLEGEEEISHLKASVVSERLKAEETVLNARQKLKNEEVMVPWCYHT